MLQQNMGVGWGGGGALAFGALEMAALGALVAEKGAKNPMQRVQVIRWEPTFGGLGMGDCPPHAPRMLMGRGETLHLLKDVLGLIDPAMSDSSASLTLDMGGRLYFKVLGAATVYILARDSDSKDLTPYNNEQGLVQVYDGDCIVFTVADGEKKNVLVIKSA